MPPRKSSSQWEFGELFPAAETETRRVLTVSELTATIRRALEKELGDVWVTGEVTNLRVQASGHVYFTLKDAGSQLSCVLFRSEAVANREFVGDGQKLLLNGNLTVYEPRGQYQLIVRAVEPQGLGALQVAFEKLKRKLQAEGLFATERKRRLPRYPQRLGLVTSPTGAAIRDVLHVIQRRQPGLQIVLAPCRVQGDGAAREIANSIRLLNEWNERRSFGEKLDVILITRGGGSLEDLWAFNEEIVARAIFDSSLPVISAVGHEIDFTIADFVADFRAATPSAAAEIITEGAHASRQFLQEAARRLRHLVRSRIELLHDDLAATQRRLSRVHPRRQLEERLQYLDDLHTRVLRCARSGSRQSRTAWLNLQQRLARLRPALVLQERRQHLLDVSHRLQAIARQRQSELAGRMQNLSDRLRLLSPENVLARGFSVTMDAASGRIIRDSSEVRAGQSLNTRLKTGTVRSVVEKDETGP